MNIEKGMICVLWSGVEGREGWVHRPTVFEKVNRQLDLGFLISLQHQGG